ncbi:MAG: substrate-binding domain-containing protein [Rhodobacteraceae bacterium]|nr:substrate-binding domain-containing protein [Paracoccaceae bacterium]
MRHALISLCLMAAAPAMAFEIEARVQFGPDNAATVLNVISTADIDLFAPVILGYLDQTPNTAVDYVAVSSGELMKALRDEGAAFDIAISSAMDLQTKLANDGFAHAHNSDATDALPEWARWRDHVFAFTQEPASIVVSRAAFQGLTMPRTRQDLIALMRKHPDRFMNRVGTYDLRLSGLGYLFATQDARTSETYWRLTEVMGSLNARLFCCSSDMINGVASGELSIAYNVLGSYARSRPDADQFEILLPTDFTTVMMRSVLIPKTTHDADLAGDFVDHVLQTAWAERPPKDATFTIAGEVRNAEDDSLRRIRLGPGLLVFLDAYKKRQFLQAWEDAILQKR